MIKAKLNTYTHTHTHTISDLKRYNHMALKANIFTINNFVTEQNF